MSERDRNPSPSPDDFDPETDPSIEAGDEAFESGEEPEARAGRAAGGPPQDQNISALLNQISEHKAQLLRANADYQNLSRRCSREVLEAGELAKFEMAKALVNVLDLFDRALEVNPAKATAESMLTGMQMVRTEFLKTLEKQGVQRLDVSAGEEFDPRKHEALMRQAVPGVEPNRIASQLQPGYVFGDRVVRAAKVAVADETR